MSATDAIVSTVLAQHAYRALAAPPARKYVAPPASVNRPIVRGTARRLGITRPIPTRILTPAERREREGQALAQSVLAVGAVLRPLVLVAEPAPVVFSSDGRWRRRRCAECGYFDDTYCWAALGSRGHLCRRNGETVMVLWSGERW